MARVLTVYQFPLDHSAFSTAVQFVLFSVFSPLHIDRPCSCLVSHSMTFHGVIFENFRSLLRLPLYHTESCRFIVPRKAFWRSFCQNSSQPESHTTSLWCLVFSAASVNPLSSPFEWLHPTSPHTPHGYSLLLSFSDSGPLGVLVKVGSIDIGNLIQRSGLSILFGPADITKATPRLNM